MKKILILAFIGLGFLTQTTQAVTPDLSDLGYSGDHKIACGCSHIIRAAASEGSVPATLKNGTTYQIKISAEELEQLKAIKDEPALHSFKNATLTSALKEGTLSLLRSGTHFLAISHSSMVAASFRLVTEEELEDDSETLEFDVTFLFEKETENETAKAYAAYLQGKNVNADIKASIMRAKDDFADRINQALVSSAAKEAISEEIIKTCEKLGFTREQQVEETSSFWPFAGGFATACAIIGAGAAYLYLSKND